MLYSRSHQVEAFDFFASFVRNILKGDERYKVLVEPIINETSSLVNRKINYFEVDRDSLDVIVFLAKKDPDFFKDIDVSTLTKTQYEHILAILSTQKEAILA